MSEKGGKRRTQINKEKINEEVGERFVVGRD